MYKVEIFYGEGCIKTKMPKIPEKGEKVGFWINGDWHIREVDYVIYEFNREGKYVQAEVNLEEG